MKTFLHWGHVFGRALPALGAAASLICVGGCRQEPATGLIKRQGYIEGEFVYVASPLPGKVQKLAVQRGAEVTTNDLLFALESNSEKIARDEAASRLTQARAAWEDLKKGKRPFEIEALTAQLKQAQAASDLAEKERERQEKLAESSRATAQQDVERARSMQEQAKQRVAQLKAELETAQQGSRSDQITAAEAGVRALEAALASAEWALSQKSQKSTYAGVVVETFYEEGEWAPAGRPVVSILPPAHVKLRVFVAEGDLAQIRVGDSLHVFRDGVSQPVPAKISFISPRPEFTPPVLYNRENRQKLLFLVEAVFAPDTARQLHPGQPVDAEFQISGRP